MFQLLVDDHLVGEQVAMSPAEQVELVPLVDEFDTDRQVRIGYLDPCSRIGPWLLNP